MEEYDVTVIGAGPAGITAGIYAARYNLKTLIITENIGGWLTEIDKIENYPGFPSIKGQEFAEKLKEHLKKFNVPIVTEDIRKLGMQDNKFIIETEKRKIRTKTMILAMGTKERKLQVPGEDEFLGKGVSFCATCDGFFFQDKVVAVVGGSDSACVNADMLTQFAKKVYIIYRGEKLRAEPWNIERVTKNSKIKIIYKTNITEIKGDKFVKEIVLDSGKTMPVDGVFIAIGSIPNSVFCEEVGIECNEAGYIKTDNLQKTNVEGVYAAGDITSSTPLRQVITAASQGAVAANQAYQHIKR